MLNDLRFLNLGSCKKLANRKYTSQNVDYTVSVCSSGRHISKIIDRSRIKINALRTPSAGRGKLVANGRKNYKKIIS